MSKQSRTDLKEKFNDGKKPTGKDFSDLIDSFVNQEDDKVQVGDKGLLIPREVAIGSENSNEKLTVDGAISLKELGESPNATNGFGKLFVKEQKLVSAEFDGESSYVSMPSLDVHVGDFTIGVWFKIDSFVHGRYHFLDFRGDGSLESESCTLFIDEVGNGLCSIHHHVTWPSGGYSQFDENIGRISGDWHHTALSREGSKLRVFLDGNLISEQPTLGGPAKDDAIPWNNSWRVGAFSDHSTPGENYWLRGSLDELGLWTRGLSKKEMKGIFLAGRGLNLQERYSSDLISYWRMGDGDILTEGTISDQINSTRKGTIHHVSFKEEKAKALHFKDSSGNEIAVGGGGSIGGGSAGSVWGKNGSDISYENGNVGIGKQDPSHSLHVVRSLEDSQNVAVFEGKKDTSSGLRVDIENETLHRPIMELRSGTTPTTKFWVGGDGNVGIGMQPDPEAKLDVAGLVGINSTVALRLTSMGNGTYDKTVLYHSEDYGYMLERARKTDSPTGEIIDWSISQRGGGTPALLVKGSGEVWAGTRTGDSADYAEYFESKTKKAIPHGTSVIIDTGKIRPAKDGETPIGVVSARPAILGNSPIEWPGKYLKDEFGKILMEKPKTKKGVKKPLPESPKLNPKYNPKKEYIPREDRPEWNIVGLLGQLPVRKGEPVAPSWIKIKNISKDVELWLVR